MISLYFLQLAIFSIYIALGVTTVCYIAIVMLRAADRSFEKKREKIADLAEDYVLEHLIFNEFSTEGQSVLIDKKKSLGFSVTCKTNRQILIDCLIKFINNVSGVNVKIVQDLYVELALYNDSIRKIKSWSWQNKVRGLQEITLMNYAISDIDILQLTLHHHPEVRSAGRCAYMKFSKNDPFRFLDSVKDPLTMWELIEFFRIVQEHKENVANSNFANWIRYSKNKTVVACCIRLAVFENQTGAIDSITGLLDNNDHELRAAAINALGKLQAFDVQDKLLRMYPSEPVSGQIEILKALAALGANRNFEFIKNEFINSSVFEVRKHAAALLVTGKNVPKVFIEKIKQDVSKEQLDVLNYYLV